MADQRSGEGSSTANVSGECSDSTVELNIKTLDSRVYSFQVDKNVSTSVVCYRSFLCSRYFYVLRIYLIVNIMLLIL